MLTKLVIALLLGVTATANEADRRYGGPRRPRGPRGPSSRFGDRFKDKEDEKEKEDYELDLDFEAVPD